MWKLISKSFLLLLYAVVICCVIYPLALWLIGQQLFPFQANGSILYDAKGKPIGSRLIAQPFTDDAYFHPRPSAASYDASASSSSSLAASNPALRNRVVKSLDKIGVNKDGKPDPKAKLNDVPADMVTTSASGLDPHITLQSAEFQLDRVSAKWAEKSKRDQKQVKAEIESILQKHASAPLMGLAGEKLVNVLEVNLELHNKYGTKGP